MGRYCSCSGAAACPVTTPLEMRKTWIPSPQMFQKLTWPKTQRHLGHVVRFVRFIPATTATISSMEPFVCKTEKNPSRRRRSCTDPDVSGGRLQVAWWSRIPGHVRSKVCETSSDSKRIFWVFLSGGQWFIDHFFKKIFLFADFFQFIRMFVTHQSCIRKHISHQGGKTAICTVMACIYTFQWALTRCQKFAVWCLQIESFIGFRDKNDTFASASWASRWTASLHLVPWSRTRPRKKMDGWGQCDYVISILLCC